MNTKVIKFLLQLPSSQLLSLQYVAAAILKNNNNNNTIKYCYSKYSKFPLIDIKLLSLIIYIKSKTLTLEDKFKIIFISVL